MKKKRKRKISTCMNVDRYEEVALEKEGVQRDLERKKGGTKTSAYVDSV